MALPEHDSVICPTEQQETVRQIMKPVYKRHTGFEIHVKDDWRLKTECSRIPL